MKGLSIVSLFSVVALLSGCGDKLPKLNSTPPSTTQPVTTEPPSPRISGDWEFSATSNVAGGSQLRFAGSIDSQTDPSKSSSDFKGALHIDGSKCFDRVAADEVTGTATADKGSVIITTKDGQVVTLTGVFAAQSPTGLYTNMMFNGTYNISGGCASGDQGKITGINLVSSSPFWFGRFTGSAQNTFDLSGDGLDMMGSPSSGGVHGVTGTIATESPCFSQGKIAAGAFPSGSFILGRSVTLEAEAGDSVLKIDGTLSDDGGVIRGNYTLSGSSCNDSGTIFFQADPWYY